MTPHSIGRLCRDWLNELWLEALQITPVRRDFYICTLFLLLVGVCCGGKLDDGSDMTQFENAETQMEEAAVNVPSMDHLAD